MEPTRSSQASSSYYSREEDESLSVDSSLQDYFSSNFRGSGRSQEEPSETISGDSKIFDTLTTKQESPQKKGSKKSLIQRVVTRSSSTDRPFPFEAINTVFSMYDKGAFKKDLLVSKLDDQLLDVAPETIIEGLVKYRRLEVAPYLNTKKIDKVAEKFIGDLVKNVFLWNADKSGITTNNPNDFKEMFDLINRTRSQINSKWHSLYDAYIVTWMPIDYVQLYSQGAIALKQINVIERMMFLSKDLQIYLRNARKADQSQSPSHDGEKISLMVAASGNPDIFIPYIAELFYTLSIKEQPLDEVRRAIRTFLQEIKSIYLGDAELIYSTLMDIQAKFCEKIEGDVSKIENFFTSMILDDTSPLLTISLIKKQVQRASLTPDFPLDSLLNLRQNLVTRGKLANATDEEVIKGLSPKQITKYARLVFDSFGDDLLERKNWGMFFVALLKNNNKLTPVIKRLVSYEMRHVPKNNSPLRGETCESILFKNALVDALSESSDIFFKAVKEAFAREELWALSNLYNQKVINDSGRTELLGLVERAKDGFVLRADRLLKNLISTPIPNQALDLLILARKALYKHKDSSKSKDYLDQERYDVVLNLWILRGIGSFFADSISTLPSKYENPSLDPRRAAITQFLNDVLLKVTIPTAYANSPHYEPLKKLHATYHEQVKDFFESEIKRRKVELATAN